MRTVLVVDDELDLVEALKAILEDEGYKVLTCGNGREALQCVAQARPDLTIVDIMMPVMNGFETIQALRQQPGLAQLPILVMSAIQPSRSAPEYGWSAFLKKPFSLREFLDKVYQLAPKLPDPEVPSQ